MACGDPCAYTFRALEVRTLHVRDLDREKRVQALGEMRDFGVCAACAERELDGILSYGRPLLRRCLPFAVILLAGAALSVFPPGGDRVFFLLGLAAVLCGILGIIPSVSQAVKKARVWRTLPREQALSQAAFEAAVRHAPAKDGDTDLTYIPVNDETLRRKNGDLMILYHLLPEIAVQAHKILHENEQSGNL